MSRILDLADESAVFAARILAGLGYDAIRVVAPIGADSARPPAQRAHVVEAIS